MLSQSSDSILVPLEYSHVPINVPSVNRRKSYEPLQDKKARFKIMPKDTRRKLHLNIV